MEGPWGTPRGLLPVVDRRGNLKDACGSLDGDCHESVTGALAALRKEALAFLRRNRGRAMLVPGRPVYVLKCHVKVCGSPIDALWTPNGTCRAADGMWR